MNQRTHIKDKIDMYKQKHSVRCICGSPMYWNGMVWQCCDSECRYNRKVEVQI